MGQLSEAEGGKTFIAASQAPLSQQRRQPEKFLKWNVAAHSKAWQFT